MATKPKADAPPAGDSESGDGKDAAPPKKSLVGRILGAPLAILGLLNPLAFLKLPLMKKLMVAGGLVVVLGGGGGAYYFLGGGAPAEEHAEGAPAEAAAGGHGGGHGAAASELPSEHAAFFDVPDIVVNIQTADSTPAYLKLSVSLELDSAEAKIAIEPVMPRVVDQFQTYLRELRVEDVRGSMGVMRLKEELLRRVNLAAAPTPVRDVLLKEMIVQ
jgi:flagellar protein FliL